MDATSYLKTRVSVQTKLHVKVAAEREFLTEATWLRRAVEQALRSKADSNQTGQPESFKDRRIREQPVAGRVRLHVRLGHDDQVILQERARARGMPPATYASVLLRSHLRNLPPLPKEELLTLKRTVSELGSIGRNLNQIARSANGGDARASPTREDLRALVRVCEAMRSHVKDLVRANLTSWAMGHEDR